MGVAYNATYARWWDGPSDVSSTTIQSDVAVIADATNGFGYRPHDAAGTSIATATPLAADGALVSASGVIEQDTQDDYYSFTTAGGARTINVSPVAFGAMLDPVAELLNSSGIVLQTLVNDPADGQPAGNPNFNLPAGTYYVMVGGEGDYGDLGQYTIIGQLANQVDTARDHSQCGIDGPDDGESVKRLFARLSVD